MKGHTHAIAQTVGQTKTAMKVVTINMFKCYTNNWPWFEHHKKIHYLNERCFFKQMSMNVTLTVPVETMLRVSTIMDPMFVTAQKDGRDMIAKMVMINTIMYLLEGYLQ